MNLAMEKLKRIFLGDSMKRKLLVRVMHLDDEIGSIFVNLDVEKSDKMEKIAIDIVKKQLKFDVTDITDR